MPLSVLTFTTLLTVVQSSLCMETAAEKARTRQAAMEEPGTTAKSRDVSLEAKATAVHTVLLAITPHRQGRRKADGDKMIHVTHDVTGELC